MNKIIHKKREDIPAHHHNHEGKFEYLRRIAVPQDIAGQCSVSIYEIPPGKSAYPYHYHTANEEVFYIISGKGVLKTPDGERQITAGDLLFFPANEEGAHRMTNTSKDEMLVYIDYYTQNDIDVTVYPDSQKLGIWGRNIDKLYKIDDKVDYYEGE